MSMFSVLTDSRTSGGSLLLSVSVIFTLFTRVSLETTHASSTSAPMFLAEPFGRVLDVLVLVDRLVLATFLTVDGGASRLLHQSPCLSGPAPLGTEPEGSICRESIPGPPRYPAVTGMLVTPHDAGTSIRSLLRSLHAFVHVPGSVPGHQPGLLW